MPIPGPTLPSTHVSRQLPCECPCKQITMIPDNKTFQHLIFLSKHCHTPDQASKSQKAPPTPNYKHLCNIFNTVGFSTAVKRYLANLEFDRSTP